MLSTQRIFAVLFALFLVLHLNPSIAQNSANQGALSFILTVKDNHQKPLAAVEVILEETITRERITKKTDALGIAGFSLDHGRTWQINILDIIDYPLWQFDIPDIPLGSSAKYTRTVSYDYYRYKRETRPAVDRSKLQLTHETQKFVAGVAKPTNELGIITILIKKSNKTALPNYPVSITCYNLNKTFDAKTNLLGAAVFLVPINNEYQIDIDGVDNFDFVDLPDRKLYFIEKTITYEPTNIKETIKNDTIRQSLMPGQKGTSGRVLTIIAAQDKKGTPWVNEVVYLQMLKDKRVYTATTNKEGKVEFLLPKGKKYMIHFKYKKDVDVMDLSRSFGIGYKSKSVIYTPSDKLQNPEKYIPKPDQIFTDQFFKFVNKQFERPKEGEGVIAYARWGGEINVNSKQAVLQLTFTSEAPPDHLTGAPLNICLVLDKSGSMAGYDRIDKLKLALIEYINKLRPEDIISIIAFDDYQKIVLSAQKVGADKEKIKDAIGRIYADNGTNIYKGLIYGYREVLKNYRKGLINRVVLLSDGYGSDDVDSTITMSKSYNAKGIECSAVGVGNDYNYPMLKSLASSGGGLIHFVGDDENMTSAFLEDLSSMLVPVAKNVKVEVIYNKHLLFAQLMGYPLEQKSDGKLIFKIKNFFSGLDQMAMVKFTLIDPTKEIENIPVTIKLTYIDARNNKPIEKISTAPLKWSEASGDLEFLLDQEQKKLYATAVMNQSIKVMAEAFQVADMAAAKAALENCMAEMKKLFPQATEGQVNILMQQMQDYLDILNNLKK
jgi:uncharacterized protein YegL